jgi:hypothetical protein
MASEGEGTNRQCASDLQAQALLLSQVLLMQPASLRLAELVRDLTAGSARRVERDRFERAAADLVGAGLLFRSGELLLPTLAALRFEAILESGESLW